MVERDVYKKIESSYLMAKENVAKIKVIVPKRRRLKLNSNLQKIAENFSKVSSKLSLADRELIRLIELYFNLDCYKVELDKKGTDYNEMCNRRLQSKKNLEFLEKCVKAKEAGRSYITGKRSETPPYPASVRKFLDDLNKERQVLEASIHAIQSKKLEDEKYRHFCEIARVALKSKTVREERSNPLSGSRYKYQKNVFHLLNELYCEIYLNYSTKEKRFQKAWEQFRNEAPTKQRRFPFLKRTFPSNEI